MKDFFQFREAFSNKQIDKKVKISGKSKFVGQSRTMQIFWNTLHGLKNPNDPELVKIMKGSKVLHRDKFNIIKNPSRYTVKVARGGKEYKFIYFVFFDGEKNPGAVAFTKDKINSKDLEEMTYQFEQSIKHAYKGKLTKGLTTTDQVVATLEHDGSKVEPEVDDKNDWEDPRLERVAEVIIDLDDDWDPRNYEENIWGSYESGWYDQGGEEDDEEGQSEFIADQADFYLGEAFEESTKIGVFKTDPLKGISLLRLSRRNLYDGVHGIPEGEYLYAAIKGKYTHYQKKGFRLAGSNELLTVKDIVAHDKGELDDYL